MEAKSHGIEPEEVGYSLANLADVLFPCLDATGARSVAEIGAFTGSLTSELLRWAAGCEARVIAIDPNAEGRLVELAAEHPELDLVYERSRDALAHIAMPDAVIFDGDHNYYAVSEDLRLLAARAGGGPLPLLLFHDVGWPHGRRDVYFEPEMIPPEHRQPMAYEATIAPSEPGLADGGLEYAWIAEREGGPRNGVLTAIEDFAEARGDMRLAVIPAFFGLGIMFDLAAPWSRGVEEVLAGFDRTPLIERIEANRVAHLVARVELVEALRERDERIARQEELLSRMLGSRAFALAERLSSIRQGSEPVFSREEIRRAISNGSDG